MTDEERKAAYSREVDIRRETHRLLKFPEPAANERPAEQPWRDRGSGRR